METQEIRWKLGKTWIYTVEHVPLPNVFLPVFTRTKRISWLKLSFQTLYMPGNFSTCAVAKFLFSINYIV